MSNLMKIEEAASYLGLKVSTLYKYTSSRRLPFIKIGARVLWSREILDKIIKDHVVSAITGK
jgi:excisionase family DNA binding protein